LKFMHTSYKASWYPVCWHSALIPAGTSGSPPWRPLGGAAGSEAQPALALRQGHATQSHARTVPANRGSDGATASQRGRHAPQMNRLGLPKH
jgi:hypothetical protein